VTGASGYVGRHVAAELARLGISATLSGRSPAEGSKFVALDIHDAPADAFKRLGSPETLIHLAWQGLPNYKEAHHVDRELPAQRRFLEHMVRDGVANIVVAGTCLEYGMQSGALDEALNCTPGTAYGVAKNSLRLRLVELQATTPFKLTWARLFYSYGDGQANSLLAQLKRAAESDDRVFRMSGGEQQRDYLPAEEMARLIVGLALNGRDNGVVNVCSGQPTTVNALVEGWLKKNGWSVRLERGYYPYPDYEPMSFWGDPAKLQRCLASPRHV
jgi:nucleoside-diphosphate-sugar epimerase